MTVIDISQAQAKDFAILRKFDSRKQASPPIRNTGDRVFSRTALWCSRLEVVFPIQWAPDPLRACFKTVNRRARRGKNAGRLVFRPAVLAGKHAERHF
jgi:hypothetical protein